MYRSLAPLKNDELARLILRQLWQFQDTAGESAKRSPTNVLLEAALSLLPLPKVHDLDFFGICRLFEEVDRRKVDIFPQENSILLLEYISDRSLAILILHSLNDLYETMLKEDQFCGLASENKILITALQLLPLPTGFKKPAWWTADDLIQDSRRRFIERCEQIYKGECQ